MLAYFNIIVRHLFFSAIVSIIFFVTPLFAYAAVPDTPTISVSGSVFNPQLNGSAYSSPSAHTSTDFQVVTTNDCTTGTVVWSAAGLGAVTTVQADSENGSYSDVLSGFDAFAYDTTYYACVRYENADGYSSWSAPASFTTESLENHFFYRQLSVANQTVTATTDYPVRIVLDNTNYDWDYSDTQGRDIRFTDSTGTVFIPYWIEHYDPSNESGVVWVLMPSIPASPTTTTIYMYNGLTSPVPTSHADGDYLFYEFEDFEDGTTGSWVNHNLTTMAVDATHAHQGAYGAQFYSSTQAARYAYWQFAAPYAQGTVAAEYYTKFVNLSGNHYFRSHVAQIPAPLGTQSSAYINMSSSNGGDFFWANGATTVTQSVDWEPSTYYKQIFYPQSGKYTGYVYAGNGNTTVPPLDSRTLLDPESPSGTLNMRYFAATVYNGRAYVDSYIVRKTIASTIGQEPVVTFGAQQTILTLPATPTLSVTGNLYVPTLTTSAYSGGLTHLSTDYKIVTSSDCTSGTIVWSSIGSDELESIVSGPISGSWNAVVGLTEGATYYACARHTDYLGSSNWSSPQVFTVPTDLTEDQLYSHDITVANSTATSKQYYQVRLYLTGTDVAFEHMDSQGRDIRITDETDTYYYPYWIEEFDAVNEKATVWVLIPSLPASPTTAQFRLHYGSASTTSRETPQAVFELWEDFEDGTIGHFQNAGIASITADNANAKHGTYAIRFQNASGQRYAYWDLGTTYTQGAYAAEFYNKVTTNTSSNPAQFMWSQVATSLGQDSMASLYFVNNKFYYVTNTTAGTHSVAHALNTYYKFLIYNLTGGNYRAYVFSDAHVASSQLYDSTARSTYGSVGTSNMRYFEATVNNNILYADTIFIRKTVATSLAGEPTITISAPEVALPAPETPSVISFENNTLTGSLYDGNSVVQESTDWRIATASDCESAGTIVWEANDSTYFQTIDVHELNGNFQQALSGAKTLLPNTQYYACVRYTSAAGDSDWSTPFAFTTEDPFNAYDYATIVSVTNNTSSTLTEYQVKIPLAGDQLAFNHMQVNAADLRIVSMDGQTVYPYWIEYVDTSAEEILIWTILDTIPASDTVDLLLLHGGNSTVDAEWYPPEIIFETFNGFEDGNVDEVTNIDLTSIGTTTANQFSGSYAADFYRASSTGGTRDALLPLPGAPYALNSYALEFMASVSQANKIVRVWGAGPQVASSSSDWYGVTFNSNGNFSYQHSAEADANSGVSYASNEYYKFAYYLKTVSTYDLEVYHNLTEPAVFSSTDRIPEASNVANLSYLSIHRIDGPGRLYIDNVFVRKAAGGIADEPTVTGTSATTINSPFITVLTPPTQQTDNSAEVDFSIELSDLQNDESSLRVEYSDDNGATWKDAYISSATVSSGVIDVNNGATYQVGATDLIDTDASDRVTIDVTWDADNAGNNSGAGGITTDEDDVLLRYTATDGVDTTVVSSSVFSVDNADPVGLGNFAVVTNGFFNSRFQWDIASDPSDVTYRICYALDQIQSQNCSGSIWDSADDVAMGNDSTSTTNITGLEENTTYYFTIFAVDSYGNAATTTTVSHTTISMGDWLQQQPLQVNNTGNPEYTNVSLQFVLTDTTHMDANCNDIRIINFDRTAMLAHWVEECDVAGNRVVVWVMVPTVAAGAVDELLMLYNNPTLDENAENPEATFLDFFDEANTTGWQNGVLSGAFDSVSFTDGTVRMYKSSPSHYDAAGVTLNPSVNNTNDVVFQTRFQSVPVGGCTPNRMYMFLADTSSAGTRGWNWNYGELRIPSTVNTSTIYTYNADFTANAFAYSTWFRTKQQIIRSTPSTTVDTFWYEDNGTLIESTLGKPQQSASANSLDMIHFYAADGGNCVDFHLDYLYVYTYIPNPPIAAIGDPPSQPSIIFPVDDATNVSVNTDVEASSPLEGTIIAADWQVSDDGTFSEDCSDANIVWCRTADTIHTTDTVVNASNGTFMNALDGFTNLQPSTEYWVRVRYKNAGGWSDWSAANHFTTALGTPPIASNVTVNGGTGVVSLSSDTATSVPVTATLIDTGGCSEISGATIQLYRSDLGSSGGDDENYRKTGTCSINAGSCSGDGDTSATISCSVDLQYYADPTDATSVNASTNWTASIIPADTTPGSPSTQTFEVNSLAAIRTINSLNFGTLGLNQDTGATNQSANIVNTGNENIDVAVHAYGSSPGDNRAMTCVSGFIPVQRMKYNVSTGFTYSSGGNQMSSTPIELDVDIPQRTAAETSIPIRFGLQIPASGVGATCSGTVVFTAISDPNVD